MNSQDYRNLQEAYLNVYQELDEVRGGGKIDPVADIPSIRERGARSSKDAGMLLSPHARAEARRMALISRGTPEATRRANQINSRFIRPTDSAVNRALLAATNAKHAEKTRLMKSNEQVDLYDLVLSHLLDEGYADTIEAAEVMMVNMSEEWREEILDEGIGSAIRGFFGKKKEPEAQKPESRGAQLRKRYNTGPEKSDTSVKRAIINRSRDNATRAQAQVDRGNASQSYADKAKGAVDSYLKAGYSKYGAGEGSGGQGGSGERGGGNKARKRAEKLNNSYDLFDYMMEYLIDEGYADTNENALVIMTNMSEEWRESILLDERIRDSPRPDTEEYIKRREIMRKNAEKAKREASTNNLIRSRKPPEPRKPDRVGNPSSATPSGEGLNPEKKPPRPRVVTPYEPPIDPSTGAPVNLKDRTSKIAPFGTVKPPFIPQAAPKKIR